MFNALFTSGYTVKLSPCMRKRFRRARKLLAWFFKGVVEVVMHVRERERSRC